MLTIVTVLTSIMLSLSFPIQQTIHFILPFNKKRIQHLKQPTLQFSTFGKIKYFQRCNNIPQIIIRQKTTMSSAPSGQSPKSQKLYHKELQQYYHQLHMELEKDHSSEQSISVRNSIKSYLVTLLKGNQHIREMPKSLKGKIARELRLLAIDRTFSESMQQFSSVQKIVMNQYANKINEQRERDGNFGDALRDLVRLARMNNVNRQHSRQQRNQNI